MNKWMQYLLQERPILVIVFAIVISLSGGSASTYFAFGNADTVTVQTKQINELTETSKVQKVQLKEEKAKSQTLAVRVDALKVKAEALAIEAARIAKLKEELANDYHEVSVENEASKRELALYKKLLADKPKNRTSNPFDILEN